ANSASFWLKQIVGGMFITVGMTGLDQEMMQKNISVKNLKDSQKNMMTFSAIMVLVNLLFLLLGGLLYLFAEKYNIATKGDDLFPSVALNTNSATAYFPPFVSIIFIIGLISALFPSADGAITALTSSFCIDILGLKRNENRTEQQQKNIRLMVHLSFTILFFLCVMMFKQINSKSIIKIILEVAGYTYGPLLGLFSFGILTKRILTSHVLTVLVCLVSPIFCYLLSYYSTKIFNGYALGIELLMINGLLTFLGLYSISKKENTNLVQNKTDGTIRR
ncbi:MAG: sodium:solute symporter, partial [Bacteroidota bacterium]|nr:sodium:solute symporter [Bacteroidota bacterium]